MKIYNKWNFALGLCGTCITLCGILFQRDDWFRLLLFGGISLYVLFTSFSKTRCERDRETTQKYKKYAKILYGRYFFVKIYLPVIVVTVVWFAAILFQSYTRILLPSWAPAAFLVTFLASAVWLLVLDHKITKFARENESSES